MQESTQHITKGVNQLDERCATAEGTNRFLYNKWNTLEDFSRFVRDNLAYNFLHLNLLHPLYKMRLPLLLQIGQCAAFQ